MKAYLLYRDADLDPDRPLLPNEAALSQDLELGALLQAMARGVGATTRLPPGGPRLRACGWTPGQPGARLWHS